MVMPGRKYSAGSQYRYGFNGKEEDDEVKGDGNQQDYGMRIYDTRLGRFLSVDPITSKYPELTPYQFASNSPVAGVDFDGLEFEQLREEIQRERQVLKNIQNKQVKTIVQTRTSNCHTISPIPNNNTNGTANGPNIFKRGFDTWFPQMMIFGNGSESIGSKPTDSRPIITVNLGEGGEANELFENIMLFTEVYKDTKVPESPDEELIETSPDLLKKTLEEIKKKMEENKKENPSNSPITPSSQTETKNVNEQKQKTKDTIYRMYSRPSGGATSVLDEATSEWKKFKKVNPKSKKEMKTFELKSKVTQND
jgi:RHS repeat-associated protein